jgi:protocadherin Fat 1/2/3
VVLFSFAIFFFFHPLTNYVHHISVLDMNDNPPKFEQPSYSSLLSEHATRGQFVTIVTASDPDHSDYENLVYTIVQGNEQQTYSIDTLTGVITLVNMQNFAENHLTMLNVSVTDGVYTSFTRVKIIIMPANLHNPTFEQLMYDVKVMENQLAGRLVGMVSSLKKINPNPLNVIPNEIPSHSKLKIYLIHSSSNSS